jgi:hypothetical protein
MKNFEYAEIYNFEVRLSAVVKKSKHIGWGYYDSILNMLNSGVLSQKSDLMLDVAALCTTKTQELGR